MIILANTIELCKEDKLNITKTFECGQCFRWNADSAGIYRGIAYSHYAEIYSEAGSVYVTSDAPKDFWEYYFALDTDYDKIDKSFLSVDYMRECIEYGKGIRILRQEPWEALCSFIISQCNNIPRIKNIVSVLCRKFGDEILPGEFAFPGAEKIAGLTAEDLSPLRCGYRAPYIINAARAVDSGELDLEMLKTVSANDAISSLMKLNGVGLKVASCAALYGLCQLKTFPVDVWMKKALKAHFPEGFDWHIFGDYAGIAQQYIFFNERKY